MEQRLVDKSDEQLKNLMGEYQTIELRLQGVTDQAFQAEHQVQASIDAKISEAKKRI